MLITTLQLLFLLCHGIGGGAHGSTVSGNSSDMLCLLDFKKAITGDPNGVLSSWNSTTPFCRWNGVACSWERPGRVVILDLAGHGLSGSISPSLGNLTLLRELNLSSNTLSGRLPPLGRLYRLEVLDLGNNSVHDRIPDAVTNCTNLRILDLRCNFIFGEVPPQVSLLSNLLVLRLRQNSITGIIPTTISNITHLQIISLSSNGLTGSIPDQLGELPNLSVLILAENWLTGGLPESL
ncbi:unnamed protein product, partial [Urochloa humidicola]